MSRNFILGISAYFHDSAAALLEDGQIVAAVQEERFSRKKNDARFPTNSIQYCLEHANINLSDVNHIVFYEKPVIKFSRILESYINTAPKSFFSFMKVMPVWIKNKLDLRQTIQNELKELATNRITNTPEILFTSHHQSHSAAAFFPSPFKQAAILCLDGVGEYTTTSVSIGSNNTITPLWEIHFPHSLGLLYSAFTHYAGFRVNSGEYKLMGLAPYGKPIYTDLILDNLIAVKNDGTFKLNMSYFDYVGGEHMINSKFEQLFGHPTKKPESDYNQHYADVAASIQHVTEQILLKLVNTIHKETNCENLCLGGGVALNCVANSKILQHSKFQNLWIQPAAGDAGNAIGAALAVWHQFLNNERAPSQSDQMKHTYLGPSFSTEKIEEALHAQNATYEKLNENDLIKKTAAILSQDKVVGWFQDRMEFGPRALGNRSILGNPASRDMQTTMNVKIKFRESFRPFAPAILKEETQNYFELNCASPYMLLVASVKENIKQFPAQEAFGLDKLKQIRSTIPAVTHVDYSARVQTVDKDANPKFYALIKEFYEQTKIPILINTSFNIRGEPIVCTPTDALNCFMRTDMDYLVLGNYLLEKSKQTNTKINHEIHLELD